MKNLASAILILFLFSCSTPPNNLDEKVEIVEAQDEEPNDSAKYLIDKGALTGKTERLM